MAPRSAAIVRSIPVRVILSNEDFDGIVGDVLRIAYELGPISRKRCVSPYGLAQIYAASNKKEDTFKWLQAAYEDHAVWMGYIAVDPIFDRYRSDGRFRDLLRRVGLL